MSLRNIFTHKQFLANYFVMDKFRCHKINIIYNQNTICTIYIYKNVTQVTGIMQGTALWGD